MDVGRCAHTKIIPSHPLVINIPIHENTIVNTITTNNFPTIRYNRDCIFSNLMAQLKDKGKLFTEEVHLKKDDPNYGRPLEGINFLQQQKEVVSLILNPDQREIFSVNARVSMLILG